jgi:hypothetical protein
LQRDYDSAYPETQAPFMWWIGDIYAASFGAKRDSALCVQDLHAKNIIWAGGSDYPVTPFAARYGLWSSVVRQTLNGVYGSQPFGTAESVDIHTALKSYTIWAAHQLFLEDRIGSLEPGKDADIAVWDRDLYSIPPDDIKNLHCELTLLRGRSSTPPLKANNSYFRRSKNNRTILLSFFVRRRTIRPSPVVVFPVDGGAQWHGFISAGVYSSLLCFVLSHILSPCALQTHP